MPSVVPGNSSCTAWASTWAVECRMTARPSALAAGTGSTSASASGAQFRSFRSPLATSRTTTAPSGPLSGTPASLSACIAVVPAATRIGGTAVGEGGADTGTPGGRWNGLSTLVRACTSARDDVQSCRDGTPPAEHLGHPLEGRGIGGVDPDLAAEDVDVQRHRLRLRHG